MLALFLCPLWPCFCVHSGLVSACTTGIGNSEQSTVKIPPDEGGRCLWSIGPHGTSFSYSLHCLCISSPYAGNVVGTFWARSLAASYSSTCTKIPVPGQYCSELVHGPVSSSYDTFIFSCPRVRRARSSLVLKLILCNHQDKHRNRKKKSRNMNSDHHTEKERKEEKNGVQNKQSATGRA